MEARAGKSGTLNYLNPRRCWWEYRRKWSKGNKLLLRVRLIPNNLCFLWNSEFLWNYFWRIDESPLANIRLISFLFSRYISNWFLLSIKSLINELESQCRVFVRLKKRNEIQVVLAIDSKKVCGIEKILLCDVFYVYIYSNSFIK